MAVKKAAKPRKPLKGSRLPSNDREAEMWSYGFEAGRETGVKDVREALIAVLGLDQRFAEKEK